MTGKALDQPEFTPPVRQAEFARMMNVSRTTVHKWARDGKIPLRADGLVDPRAAIQQLMRHTDPSKLKARALREISQETQRAESRAAYWQGYANEIEGATELFIEALARDWETVRDIPPAEALKSLQTRFDDALLSWADAHSTS